MKQIEYCPYCSGKYTRTSLFKLLCKNCGEVLYRNSNPCCGALVVDDRGRVLLVRRGREPYKGYWDIPGGFLNPGEHPEDAVVREFFEETGLKIKPIKIFGIFMDRYGAGGDYTLNIHYLANIISGKITAGSDAVDYAWFSKDKLPKKIAFKNGREALEMWRKNRD